MSEFDLPPNRRTFRADLERQKEIQAYYRSIRKPAWERVTFALALAASILAALRIGNLAFRGYGDWIALFYCVSFLAFVGLDAVFAKAHHPISLPLGGFNPGRICEKFAMQERSWQLFLVLMLPVTVRLFKLLIFVFHL